MKRFYGIVDGRVQGVGFRLFLQLQALNFKCTGWVRNLDNGCVEFHLQGSHDSLLEVLAIIRKGNQFIRVDDLQVKEIELLIEETSFKIRYS